VVWGVPVSASRIKTSVLMAVGTRVVTVGTCVLRVARVGDIHNHVRHVHLIRGHCTSAARVSDTVNPSDWHALEEESVLLLALLSRGIKGCLVYQVRELYIIVQYKFELSQSTLIETLS
jgi:hypothetical protein